MSTHLLYHQNDYMSSFEATVLAIDKDSRSVILDSTTFYPTGGYQRCDQGKIQKTRNIYLIVADVQKDDCGLVHHYYVASKGNIQPGDKIKGLIHWERRFRHMQLHTAQHIFSRYARDRFGIGSGHADFSPQGGLVVMDTSLTWEQVILLEDDVNRVIAEGRNVSRSIDEAGVITIAIGEIDKNPCGGTHVKSTSEIEMFKITGMHDRNIRYEAGDRAKVLSVAMANRAIEAAAMLESGEAKDLTKAVAKLIAERDRAYGKLEAWKKETTERQISIANQTAIEMNAKARVFRLDLSHMSSKAVKNLLRKHLVQENQVWICMAERRNMLISSGMSVVNAKELLQQFVDKWKMRGDGNRGFAQAGPVPEEITDPLGNVTEWLLSANGEENTE